MNNYEQKFYEMMRTNETHAKSTARFIVPIIMDLVNPNSVVDLGCAIGIWLHYFKLNGASKIMGFDGGNIDKRLSYLDDNEFEQVDFDKGFYHNDRYDLAISLEVAEHVSPKKAESFIDNLVKLSDVVLFSAAIPYQSGEAHINEQWQSYWASKFKKRGYVVVDCLREKLWNTSGYIYAQNMFIYVKEDKLPNYPNLMKERELNQNPILDLVHPKVYQPAVKPDHEIKHLIKIQKDLIKAFSYKLKLKLRK